MKLPQYASLILMALVGIVLVLIVLNLIGVV